MANPTINIKGTDLEKAAVTHQKEILILPVISAQRTLQHMTGIAGIAGRHTFGEFSGEVEIGPYDAHRETEGVNVNIRTLETFLGSLVHKFDVNEAAKTIYGTAVSQGEALKNADIARQVLEYLSSKVGQKLERNIWKAKRNDSGTKTEDLFDGFDTITEKEINATNIDESKNNLFKVGEAITENNAIEKLQAFYQSVAPELQDQETKLFMPYDVYNKYCKDYAQEFGANPYNTQYKKTVLEGSDGRCELVPLSNKKGSKYLHLTTKGNCFYGYGDGLAEEKIAVEKHHALLLDFVATMYFGCQFKSISPEMLCVAELTV